MLQEAILKHEAKGGISNINHVFIKNRDFSIDLLHSFCLFKIFHLNRLILITEFYFAPFDSVLRQPPAVPSSNPGPSKAQTTLI